jgi:hypothetical protein
MGRGTCSDNDVHGWSRAVRVTDLNEDREMDRAALVTARLKDCLYELAFTIQTTKTLA